MNDYMIEEEDFSQDEVPYNPDNEKTSMTVYINVGLKKKILLLIAQNKYANASHFMRVALFDLLRKEGRLDESTDTLLDMYP